METSLLFLLKQRLLTPEVLNIISFNIIILCLEMGIGVKLDNEFLFKE